MPAQQHTEFGIRARATTYEARAKCLGMNNPLLLLFGAARLSAGSAPDPHQRRLCMLHLVRSAQVIALEVGWIADACDRAEITSL